MPNLSLADLTTVQLRRAVAIKEQIEALESELGEILDVTSPRVAKRGRGRPKTRGVRRQAAVPAVRGKKRRKMSAAARAKLRASAKARWAAVKAKGQTKL